MGFNFSAFAQNLGGAALQAASSGAFSGGSGAGSGGAQALQQALQGAMGAGQAAIQQNAPQAIPSYPSPGAASIGNGGYAGPVGSQNDTEPWYTKTPFIVGGVAVAGLLIFLVLRK